VRICWERKITGHHRVKQNSKCPNVSLLWMKLAFSRSSVITYTKVPPFSSSPAANPHPANLKSVNFELPSESIITFSVGLKLMISFFIFIYLKHLRFTFDDQYFEFSAEVAVNWKQKHRSFRRKVIQIEQPEHMRPTINSVKTKIEQRILLRHFKLFILFVLPRIEKLCPIHRGQGPL